MKRKQARSPKKELNPAEWVRGGFRKRHNLTDADLKEMLKPENTRVIISIKLPLDVLDFFKANAEKSGTPYQTQINHLLRAHVDEQRNLAQGGSPEIQTAARHAKSALNHLLETLKHVEHSKPKTNQHRANNGGQTKRSRISTDDVVKKAAR